MSYHRPDRPRGRPPGKPLTRWEQTPPPRHHQPPPPPRLHQPHQPHQPHTSPCPQRSPPGFSIVLFRRPSSRGCPNPKLIEDLISCCPVVPVDFCVFAEGYIAGKLFFQQWCHALDALEFLWRRRLESAHLLAIKLIFRVSVPSHNVELEERLKGLFTGHINGLLEGECLHKISSRVIEISAELKKVVKLLSRPKREASMLNFREEKKSLEVELALLKNRLEEFRAAMGCLLDHLAGKKLLPEEGGVEIFRFGSNLDWAQIHHFILRECKRLDSGLPIYSCRREILNMVSSNQVMVLIGETGSGKSTQLAQYLADSGLATKGSIICSQPRKIAALSLARRVCEETIGVYADNFISSFAAYSSSQILSSGIIYMTDHCLLQHYMNDTSLSGISYIIVDEAHERSLNTDLLLALIKKEMFQRNDLRIIIMSATADVIKLSDFFYGCSIFSVEGRTYPVDIKYVTDVTDEDPWYKLPMHIPSYTTSYLSNVIKMVGIIHKKEQEGGILAFLTSQMEVEWACENFSDPSAVVLPLHGKLSNDDQFRVFNNYPGKRKIIFSTNVAETSLTIHGIKYVVDSGMVKDSRFEPSTGMNLLKVTWTSQSSANQRSGRAGRTEPGKCYRLYSKLDFHSMTVHQEPEIRKVHLGIALLRILILGMKNIKDFEFVDAPSPEAIDKAMQNLIYLGAVVSKNHFFELTLTGRALVKMGIEPRLGKIILDSFSCGLLKEGLVLAAVMANYSSIFCRVGSNDEKHKADCLKVPFCHPQGDLFTLLSVYKEWESEQTNKNQWCWQNSINAKSMRRCHETLVELENCLKYDLNMITPSYWLWNPHKPSEYDKYLKKVILSSLVDNVALYTGSDRLGYEVALTGKKLQLHPSCSLLIYGQKPNWVVFTEILSIENQYLVCVSAVDYESLCEIKNPPFILSQLEERKMLTKVVNGLGVNLLRRLCGKSNHNLESITSCIKKECMDEHIHISTDFDRREIHLFAAAKSMEKFSSMVNDVLDCERRLLRDECMEKSLYISVPGSFPSIALFGSGAEIKHLELDNRCLTVEIFHPCAHEVNDKELILFIDKNVPGIVNFSKLGGSGQDRLDSCKWGKVTFLKPEDAQKAVANLSGLEFKGNLLKIVPVVMPERRILPFSAVRTKVSWPRKPSKGVALVECSADDAEFIVNNCCPLVIGDNRVNCAVSTEYKNCLFVSGIRKDISEKELFHDLLHVTKRNIRGVRLLRGDPINSLPIGTCAQALIHEITPFMPNHQHSLRSFRVEVYEPEPRDSMVRACISFDGSLHLEAAKALDHIQGKALPGCFPWQKIECHDIFNSSISCPARIFSVIKSRLESLLESFKHQKGVTYSVDRNFNGSYRVKLSAHATKIIADLRKPLEQLMKGKTVTHPSLTPSLIQLLLSRDGIMTLKSLEKETGTYIFYDRHNLHIKLFGSPDETVTVEDKLVQSLQSLYDNRQHEIRLRGHNLAPNLMKEVIKTFGAELQELKLLVPGVELTLNTRWHILSVRGSTEQKQKVEEVISNITLSLNSDCLPVTETMCPICLCEMEEPFCLESCGHKFCQGCLANQCEAAIRSRDGFPLCCTKEGCQSLFLLTDLKSLLLGEKLEELFQASMIWFVTTSGGAYRFCPTPDCPGIYKVAVSEEDAVVSGPFICGACSVETCRWCHLEYHSLISCELYKGYKDSPDFSLFDWRMGKENVKDCPGCKHVIEKVDGCNHVECRCGRHICWVCLEVFSSSEDCYTHLRSSHEI